jgi:hypothetical protein
MLPPLPNKTTYLCMFVGAEWLVAQCISSSIDLPPALPLINAPFITAHSVNLLLIDLADAGETEAVIRVWDWAKARRYG